MSGPDSGLQLDGSWPGLDSSGGDLRVDPEVITEVGRRLKMRADGMDADLSNVGGPYMVDARRSTTSGFESATEMPEGEHWFGEWPTAGEMEHGLRMARHHLTRYYRQLVGEVRAAGRLLEQVGQAYADADHASAVQVELAGDGGAAAGAGASTGAGGSGGTPVAESGEVPKLAFCEDVSQHDPEWIVQVINRLRQRSPWHDLSISAGGFRSTGERLADLAEYVRSQAGALAEVWVAPAQDACQRALQRIAGTASHLSERAENVGTFAEESADQMSRQVAEFPQEVEGRSFGEWVGDAVNLGDDPNLEAKKAEVRQALGQLNSTYSTTNMTHLPASIDMDTPGLAKAQVDQSMPPERPDLSPPGGGPGGTSARDVVGGEVPVGPGAGGSAGFGAGESSESGGLEGAAPGVPVGGVSGGGVPAAGGGGAPSGGAGGAGAGVGPGVSGARAGVVSSGGAVRPSAGGARAGVMSSAPAGGAGGGHGRVAPGGAGAVGGGHGRAAPGASGGAAGRGAGAAGGAGARAGTVTQPGHGMVGGGARGGAAAAGQAGGSDGGSGARGGARAGHAMPGGRQGGSQDREQRHAQADDWLREDEDPWTGDDEAPPGVLR